VVQPSSGRGGDFNLEAELNMDLRIRTDEKSPGLRGEKYGISDGTGMAARVSV